MQYDEFIGQVQHRARLATREEAVAATRATLETLAERLGSELHHVVAQLPREIAYYTTRAISTQKMALSEFYERVSVREPCDLPKATFHARVVMSVLEDALTPGEMKHVRDQLPGEFAQLFAAQEFRADYDQPGAGNRPAAETSASRR